MMALLDKPEAPFVAPLVMRVATDYPEAARFPFQVSKEFFVFGSDRAGEANRRAVEAIADKVRAGERHPVLGVGGGGGRDR